MPLQKTSLLILNAGSSSIKFALYQTKGLLTATLIGSIDNIAQPNTSLHFIDMATNQQSTIEVHASSFATATGYLLKWFETNIDFAEVKAIGHRIVQGFTHTEAEVITPHFLNELKQLSQYDPEHLPSEIILIEAFVNHYPALTQVACFDTAFHSSIPTVAKLLPIPKKYVALGLRRYGFHGLSYAYLMQALHFVTDDEPQKEKIILAHLGNGASLAAIKNGICIDTSMGFTPAAGLVMATRTGDIDPGVAWYLMAIEKLTPQQFNDLINHQSGMLAVSETTGDMREIIKNKNTDTRAADAFNLFCYQAKKFIGAYTAALEGLNTLVFSGGIGEHSPEVRSQICDGLAFLGIEIDEIKNMNNEQIISTNASTVMVRVIKTNEQLMIAQLVLSLLKKQV